MSPVFGNGRPALFLGIADFFDSSSPPFPIGGIDLFQLSQHKFHIVYPGMIQSNVWVVVAESEFLKKSDISKWKLRIVDENDSEFASVDFAILSNAPEPSPQPEPGKHESVVLISSDSEVTVLNFRIDRTVPRPGKYIVYSEYDGSTVPIGSIQFHYRKSPTLTPDQIKAIESDPSSAKSIEMDLGCKLCPTKLKAYTGLSRSPRLESQGCIWQTELDNEFVCGCGRTRISLEYLKESMHGLLLKDFSREHTGLSYVRRYGHSKVARIVGEFIRLLDTERLENPIQKFIEKNPILLSRFHAKRLFVKPDIVGRFEADFAIVDSRNQLWLIELERPSLQLFKRDGFPTQALMHAYGQVTDWLRQYSKYPGAILDALGLKAEDVVSVRGAVIAGRSKGVTLEFLQRHMSLSPYPNIEFITCDDLGVSLLEISKKIA